MSISSITHFSGRLRCRTLLSRPIVVALSWRAPKLLLACSESMVESAFDVSKTPRIIIHDICGSTSSVCVWRFYEREFIEVVRARAYRMPNRNYCAPCVLRRRFFARKNSRVANREWGGEQTKTWAVRCNAHLDIMLDKDGYKYRRCKLRWKVPTVRKVKLIFHEARG
jgi:hypothetical protein